MSRGLETSGIDVSKERSGNSTEGLWIGRGRDNRIGQHVGSGHVGAMIDNPYDLAQVVLCYQRFSLVAVVSTALVAANNETAHVAPLKHSNGLNKHRLTLPAC